MSSKEECEKALEHLIECKQRKLCDKCKFKLRCTMSNDELVINQLIEEHFELLNGIERIIDKAKELSNSNDELRRTVCSLDYALSDVYNPKPYKFEELKPNIWVWDNVAKECLYVVRPFITTGVRVKYFTCLGIWNLEKIKKLNMKFEENRFFPVEYANIINIKKENKKQ